MYVASYGFYVCECLLYIVSNFSRTQRVSFCVSHKVRVLEKGCSIMVCPTLINGPPSPLDSLLEKTKKLVYNLRLSHSFLQAFSVDVAQS